MRQCANRSRRRQTAVNGLTDFVGRLNEIGQLQEALRLDPRHAPSLFWAGAIHLQASHPAEALPLLRRVHELDPQNVQAFALAGDAALRLSKPAEALRYLERALALEPANAQLREMLDRARLAAAIR